MAGARGLAYEVRTGLGDSTVTLNVANTDQVVDVLDTDWMGKSVGVLLGNSVGD